MKLSNRPTRGTPLSEEEKRRANELKPRWWGGARFNMMPSRGKGSQGNGKRPSRAERGRSDWHGR